MAVSIFIFRTSFSSSSACKIKSKQTKITKKGKWFEFYKPLIIIFIFIFKFFEIQAMVKMAMMLHASVQPQGKPISRFNHCIKISRSPLENYGMWKLRNMKQMWREREESDAEPCGIQYSISHLDTGNTFPTDLHFPTSFPWTFPLPPFR